MFEILFTVCPGSSEPFHITVKLHKTGHYFLDTQYIPDPDPMKCLLGPTPQQIPAGTKRIHIKIQLAAGFSL